MERYRSCWKCWHCRREEPRGGGRAGRGARAPVLAGAETHGAGSLWSCCPGGLCSRRASPLPAADAGWPRWAASSPSRTAFPGSGSLSAQSCRYAGTSVSPARDYHLKHLNPCYFEAAIIPALTMTDQCAVSD